MRLLRLVGMVETEACYDETGQHSNYWDLTDPFDIRGQLDSLGTPIAGAVNPDGAPPSPMMGGDVSDDGGAPSGLTAPPLDPDYKKRVCEEDDTRALRAAQWEEKRDGTVEQITAQWMGQLPPGTERYEASHALEIRWWAEHLLIMGWTLEALAASIDEPKRRRGEWPREWAERQGVPKLKVAKTPPDSATERQKRAEDEERRVASFQTAEGKAVLAELKRRIGKPVDAPEV
jgi:hypothetical protein